MARKKNTSAVDAKIKKAEDKAKRLKKEYEAAVDELKNLREEKSEYSHQLAPGVAA